MTAAPDDYMADRLAAIDRADWRECQRIARRAWLLMGRADRAGDAAMSRAAIRVGAAAIRRGIALYRADREARA